MSVLGFLKCWGCRKKNVGMQEFYKSQNWHSPVIWIRDLGVCYGFINPEVNHVAFQMTGCSESKVCINCWFMDCWIQKPNFYYELVDPQWFFSIMDLWIQNAYFELRIDECRMVFQLWIFCIFLFWINIVIHVLPEAPLWEITGRANLKFYRKCQSENLPVFIIRNAKNKCIRTVLSLHNLVGEQEQKCRGTGRNCLFKFIGWPNTIPLKPIWAVIGL